MAVGIDVRDDLQADVVGDIRQLPIDCSPDVLTMSPPCTEFARWTLPWLDEPEPDLSLVESCMDVVEDLEPELWVLENSRGLHQYWREADQHVGPFSLWGNLPPIEADVDAGKMSISGERPEEHAKIPYELADAVRRDAKEQRRLIADGGHPWRTTRQLLSLRAVTLTDRRNGGAPWARFLVIPGWTMA